MEENATNKDTLKSSFLYVGLQIATILFSFLRNKILALFTGVAGMGLLALYSAPINLLATVVNFGLPFSAVREIAKAKAEENENIVFLTIRAFLLTLCVFGLLAVTAGCIFHKNVLEHYLNDGNLLVVFVIGVVAVLNVFADGLKSILQALRLRRRLAVASLFGLVLSMFVSIPLIILFRDDGILYSLLSGSLVLMLSMLCFAREHIHRSRDFTYKSTWKTSRHLVSSGFKFSVSQQLGALSKLGLIAFLNRDAGVEFVGYYSVASVFILTYFGMIISSLTTDFYPKMVASFSNGSNQVVQVINNQFKSSFLIVFPILVVFANTTEIVIRLTLTSDFLIIETYLLIALLGVYIQILNSVLGLVSFAAGKKNFFLFFEGFLMNFSFFVLSILGYLWKELEGIAFFFVIYQCIYFASVSIWLNRYMKFKIERIFFKEFSILGLFLIVLSFLKYTELKSLGFKWSYLLSVSLLTYCVYKLNKIYNIRSFLVSKIIRR